MTLNEIRRRSDKYFIPLPPFIELKKKTFRPEKKNRKNGIDDAFVIENVRTTKRIVKKKKKSARYGREQGEVRTRAADLGPAQVERSLVNASPPPPCDRTHSAEEEKKGKKRQIGNVFRTQSNESLSIFLLWMRRSARIVGNICAQWPCWSPGHQRDTPRGQTNRWTLR